MTAEIWRRPKPIRASPRSTYGARVAERYRELEAARPHLAELERELAKCRGCRW